MRLCACTVSCSGIVALGIDAILYRLGHRSEAYLVVVTLARLEAEYRGYTVISWLEICLESCRSKRDDSLFRYQWFRDSTTSTGLFGDE